MKRSEFIKFTSSKRYNGVKREFNDLPTSVDPTQAQSGRDMLFNPKPIKYRGTYSNGVPSKDMQVFDKMYADKFDSFAAAFAISKDVQDKYEKLPKDEPK